MSRINILFDNSGNKSTNLINRDDTYDSFAFEDFPNEGSADEAAKSWMENLKFSGESIVSGIGAIKATGELFAALGAEATGLEVGLIIAPGIIGPLLVAGGSVAFTYFLMEGLNIAPKPNKDTPYNLIDPKDLDLSGSMRSRNSDSPFDLMGNKNTDGGPHLEGYEERNFNDIQKSINLLRDKAI
jgi:hypothetical protein